MSASDNRESFEKWACKNGYSIEIYKRGDGSYHHADTEDAWRGWQAALSAQAPSAAVGELEALCDEFENDDEPIYPSYFTDRIRNLIKKAASHE